jgi:hypothetical protein
VAFIQANRRTFYTKYYVDIEQMSVSQAVYDFWAKVKSQKEDGSNLFQTPSPKTTGNIKPSSTGSTSILGVFAASAIKKQSIVIYRNDVPYPLPAIDTVANSCLQLYKNTSNVKPLFW